MTPTHDLLFYACCSSFGGLLNRPGGATSGSNTVPFELESDEVKNYEWAEDGAVRSAALQRGTVDIRRLQTTVFDQHRNLFFSDNAADAKILGIEADFTYAPYVVPG